MRVVFDGGWTATVAGGPLPLVPRFEDGALCLDPCGGRAEWGPFVAGTFGSDHFLWDLPDVFRFDSATRMLAGVRLELPFSAYAETAGLPALPPVREGGLRADEVRDFRHEICQVLCRATGDGELACLRDLDVLDAPVDARIGIARDVALLVQRGAVVGWSLTDPARYLTSVYRAPDPEPPAPATRRLLSDCLDLLTEPVADDLVDGEPGAVARLRAVDEELRGRREDRHRAVALRELIATYVEHYGGG